MKRVYKWISLTVCAVMLLSLLPVISFAEADDSLDPEDILGVVLWKDTDDDTNNPLSGTIVEYDGKACVLTWGVISDENDEYAFYNKHIDGESLKIEYTAPDESFVLLSLPSSVNVPYRLSLNENEPEETDVVTIYYMDFSNIDTIDELDQVVMDEEYATVTSVNGNTFSFDGETAGSTYGGLVVCDGYAVGIMTAENDGDNLIFNTGVTMKSISEMLGTDDNTTKKSGSSDPEKRSEKKNDLWLILLFVAIGIALVGLVIYVIVNKNKTKKQPVQQYSPASPTPYPDPMQNGYPEQQNAYQSPQNYYPEQPNAYQSPQNYYPEQPNASSVQQNPYNVRQNAAPVIEGVYPEQMNVYPENGSAYIPPQEFDSPMDKTVPLDMDPQSFSDNNGEQRLCIQGKGGVFDGRKFKLQGELLIGRQPGRCGICYPADTAGISGLHCRIRKVGNALELTDLGSSYGTFANDSKLAPNVPVFLQPGENFWLADPMNTFIVYA